MNISITRFGPIETLSLDINEFNIIIGKQASGKSTLSKLIYYFLNLRDETYDFIVKSLQENTYTEINKRLEALYSKRFVEFFGPMIHEQQMRLSFEYSNRFHIEIIPDNYDKKFIRISVSDRLLGLIVEIIKQNSEKFQKDYSKVRLFMSSKTTYSNIEIEKIQKEIQNRLDELFGFSYDLLFIPAGRSILSTLADQLQNIHSHLLDFPMRTFITKIANTNSFFKKSIDQIIKEKEVYENRILWKDQIGETKEMIEKIIKGQYNYDDGGGKIFVKKNKYVKINFTSSGQQESMWIVLTLFLIVLDSIDAMVFIEEPEAHLFPEGQKDIIEFIALVRSFEKTKYCITTHSPYILSALNNCLYADKLKKGGKNTSPIFNNNYCICIDTLSALLIENGEAKSIIDNELKLIDVGQIDDCSKSINDTYSALEDLEFNNA